MTALEQARTRRDLTQTKLAELSGVDQATISRAENGEQMGRKSAMKMAAFLGFELSVYQLMFPPAQPDTEPAKMA